MEYLAALMKNDIFILNLAVVLGITLGKIKFKGISLGISGTLFSGLLLGIAGFSVPYNYFSWNLVIFVVAVGLIASEDIVMVIKKYGARFIVLGILVTSAGAMLTLIFGKLFSVYGQIDPLMVAGSYTGALTSSPGLGAALEATGGNPLVTAGYSIAYPFGVIAVVLFVQLAPPLFRFDLQSEREKLKSDFFDPEDKKTKDGSVSFATLSFVLCILIGVAFGKVYVPFPVIGKISLGTTGGALIVALFLGALGSLGPLSMRMDYKILSALRSLSLAYFLAVVGLMAGPDILDAVRESGFALIFIGFFAALGAELVGFVVGKYIFRMNWILLAGAICGAMTSTPGLGAAIDATGGEECGSGYGATYPIAILCMVIFTRVIAGMNFG